MNRDPKVSIIMPAYNAEKDISKCIQSIIKQSMKEWELIIIDDGSIDSTYELCKQYAKIDARIQIFHQTNMGVSMARNSGIEKSKGIYIVFVDADDILPENSLEIRLQLINNVDMAVASYQVIDQYENKIETMVYCERKFWDQKQALSNVIRINGEIGYQGYLWNKIFLRSIVIDNNLRFYPNISYNEDRLFVIDYLLHSKKVRLSNELVYKYYQNQDGAMGCLIDMKDKDCDKLLTEFVAYQIMCNKLKRFDKNLYYLCAADAQGRACWLYKEASGTTKRLKKSYRKYIRIFGTQTFYFGKGSLSLKKRMKILAHVILAR